MATPSLSRHTIPGALGDILVDVRAGGRSSPRPAVAVVHGFKGFKDWGMFPPFAERLARAGFTAVTFNMSGSGVDEAGDFTRLERFRRNTYSAELADLASVVGALEQGRLGVAPPTGVGLVGHSRGGGIAVLHAAKNRRVRSLVTWAAIANPMRWSDEERTEWRAHGHLDVVNSRTGQVMPLSTEVLDDMDLHERDLNIEVAARRVSVPWLIIHGTADDAVSVDDAESLQAENARDTTRLLRIDGAGHTFGATHPWSPVADAPIDRVIDATLSWLVTSLG